MNISKMFTDTAKVRKDSFFSSNILILDPHINIYQDLTSLLILISVKPSDNLLPPGDEMADLHDRVKHFCGVKNEELLEKLK